MIGGRLPMNLRTADSAAKSDPFLAAGSYTAGAHSAGKVSLRAAPAHTAASGASRNQPAVGQPNPTGNKVFTRTAARPTAAASGSKVVRLAVENVGTYSDGAALQQPAKTNIGGVTPAGFAATPAASVQASPTAEIPKTSVERAIFQSMSAVDSPSANTRPAAHVTHASAEDAGASKCPQPPQPHVVCEGGVCRPPALDLDAGNPFATAAETSTHEAAETGNPFATEPTGKTTESTTDAAPAWWK